MKKLMKAIFRPQHNMVDICGIFIAIKAGLKYGMFACILTAVIAVCISIAGKLLTRDKL